MTVAGRYARALSVVPASEALHEADLFCQQSAAQAALPENGGGRRAPGDHAASRLAAPASPGSAATAARGLASASVASCPWLNQSLSVSQRVHLLLAQMTLADKISMVTGAGFSEPYVFYISAIPRLCVPAMGQEDGPVGVGRRPHRRDAEARRGSA